MYAEIESEVVLKSVAKIPVFLHLLFCFCVVLYLYIYIALLAVHTNQKRFQCERPREESSLERMKRGTLLTS